MTTKFRKTVMAASIIASSVVCVTAFADLVPMDDAAMSETEGQAGLGFYLDSLAIQNVEDPQSGITEGLIELTSDGGLSLAFTDIEVTGNAGPGSTWTLGSPDDPFYLIAPELTRLAQFEADGITPNETGRTEIVNTLVLATPSSAQTNTGRIAFTINQYFDSPTLMGGTGPNPSAGNIIAEDFTGQVNISTGEAVNDFWRYERHASGNERDGFIIDQSNGNLAIGWQRPDTDGTNVSDYSTEPLANVNPSILNINATTGAVVVNAGTANPEVLNYTSGSTVSTFSPSNAGFNNLNRIVLNNFQLNQFNGGLELDGVTALDPNRRTHLVVWGNNNEIKLAGRVTFQTDLHWGVQFATPNASDLGLKRKSQLSRVGYLAFADEATTQGAWQGGISSGLSIENLSVDLALGRLAYQPLTFSIASETGDLSLSLAQIPGDVNAPITDPVNAIARDFYADPLSKSNIKWDNMWIADSAGTPVEMGGGEIRGLRIHYLNVTTCADATSVQTCN